jgi:transposase-like protein
MSTEPKTWKALAAQIDCTPETLSKWRRQNADSVPKTKDVEAWKNWLVNHKSAGHGSGRIALDGKNYTKQDLIDLKGALTGEQARRERAMANLRELEFRMKSESLVPQSEVSETLIKLLTPLRRLLDALPRQAARIANPQNPNVAELAIRNVLDERVFAEIEKIMIDNKK